MNNLQANTEMISADAELSAESALNQLLLPALYFLDDVRAVQARSTQLDTSRRELCQQSARGPIDMGDIAQKQMNFSSVRDCLVGTGLDYLDMLIDEFTINGDRDDILLIRGENPNHPGAPLP